MALKPGDKVVVNLTLKNFRQLQDNDVYGGWDDGMKQVRQVQKGRVLVKYEG